MNYAEAVVLQYWGVEKAADGTGMYDLACYSGRVGQTDAALYWLQRAGVEEGVDAPWASQDPDLQAVRSDPRWGTVQKYLQDCNSYWSGQTHSETQLVLPAGVVPGEAIPVMIGLHGMGSCAADFISAEQYQDVANQKRIAFLGVSGTVPRGRRSFVWSEDATRDAARIEAALVEVKDRLTPLPGKCVLFGFSQGAMMSAEVAVQHRDKYSGALVMSPGGRSSAHPEAFVRGTDGLVQNAICLCGAGEHPGNVELTKTYADLFRATGARVQHKAYPQQNSHTLPPDYAEKLPEWIDFLLGK